MNVLSVTLLVSLCLTCIFVAAFLLFVGGIRDEQLAKKTGNRI